MTKSTTDGYHQIAPASAMIVEEFKAYEVVWKCQKGLTIFTRCSWPVRLIGYNNIV